MQPHDITTTTFGLLIAYFLPGLALLFSARYWVPEVDELFARVAASDSNFALFLLVVFGALTAGLLITPVAALIFQEFVSRKHRLSRAELASLSAPGRSDSLRTLIDEQYRYHQCWANLSVALVPLITGWLKHNWHELDSAGRPVAIGLSVLVESVTIWAAIEAYRRYIARAGPILTGDPGSASRASQIAVQPPDAVGDAQPERRSSTEVTPPAAASPPAGRQEELGADAETAEEPGGPGGSKEC